MSDTPVFLYLHLPKTGGSTLGTIIHQQYHDGSYSKSEKGYFRAGLYYLPDGFIRKAGDQLSDDERNAIARKDLRGVLGHFEYGMHEHITPRPYRYMTALRDPVQRVLSLFHHLRQFDQLPAGMTVEQFVTTPHIHEACNDQVRRLAGTHTAEPCTQQTLDRAIEHMNSRIDFTAITERFDASMLVAKQVFGWTGNINYIPRLVNTKRKAKPAEDPDTLELIEAHNRLDVELYRAANQLLDARIAAVGPGFEQQLEDYTRKNREQLDAHGPASTLS